MLGSCAWLFYCILNIYLHNLWPHLGSFPFIINFVKSTYEILWLVREYHSYYWIWTSVNYSIKMPISETGTSNSSPPPQNLSWNQFSETQYIIFKCRIMISVIWNFSGQSLTVWTSVGSIQCFWREMMKWFLWLL